MNVPATADPTGPQTAPADKPFVVTFTHPGRSRSGIDIMATSRKGRRTWIHLASGVAAQEIVARAAADVRVQDPSVVTGQIRVAFTDYKSGDFTKSGKPPMLFVRGVREITLVSTGEVLYTGSAQAANTSQSPAGSAPYVVTGIQLSRIRGMVDNAVAGGAKRVVFRQDSFTIKLLGSRSRRAGQLAVTSPDGSEFFGYVNEAGTWEPRSWVRGNIIDAVKDFECDPAKYAAAYGHRNQRCCFCSKPITTTESQTVGYGPDCAKKMNLPWGGRR